jgi:hypothetical protein
MFVLLGIIVLALGFIPLIRALATRSKVDEERFRKRLRVGLIVVIADILFIIAFNVFANLYTEFLWFRNLGYQSRFLKALRFEVILYFAGFAAAFLFIYLNVRHAFGKVNLRLRRFVSFPLALGISLLLGIGTSGMWQRFLLFFNQVRSGVTDPIFGKSVSYYLFSLPLFSDLVGWLILVFLLTLGIVLVSLYGLFQQRGPSPAAGEQGQDKQAGIRALTGQVMVLIALPLFVLAWNSLLNIYRLLYSQWGVVYGPGYVDENFRVLGYAVSIAVYAAAGVLMLVAAARPSFRRKLFGVIERPETGGVQVTGRIAIVPAVAIVVLILFTGIIPAIVNALVVKPNEISLERPYLAHNIEFTRRAYGLSEERIEERQYTVGRDVSRRVTAENEQTLMNVRLWDPRALRANLKQTQEIRLYYEFFDVDIDRYMLNGDYRQVMLSARELEKEALNIESQTWVSRQLKYTHGYGLVLLPAHDFLPQGRPDLLIRGIPPEEDLESLEVRRPEIYYGELTRDHVYVLTSQEEFDYPSGERNVYTTYEGEGGVVMDSLFKKFIFSWKNDGFRLFLSSYITRDSRVMFHREIRERAATLAPFLTLDRDPYAVLSDDGRIKYIFDAYTVSSDYPYSEMYTGFLGHFAGNNYLRNSVKAVIDAYDGTVELYIVDADDIIIQTYNNIFPELFKPIEEMPEDILRHIRYPEDFLTVQARMYSIYHMTDVEAFYQREDVWQFATERYRENFQPVEPYYMMIHLPGQPGVEFALIIPFTPQNKNVLNAWMAGRCDAPNYGKIVVYSLPKGVEVLGPRQIEARIDQDTEMSRSLSLWSQRGSEVVRGNLLVIPLFESEQLYMLYVEPIFLQAEDAQLPEIKRVVMADNERVVWAAEFEDALSVLVGEAERRTAPEVVEAPTEAAEPAAVSRTLRSQIDSAVAAFDSYKEALSREDFAAAGEHLAELNRLINSISQQLTQ